ncbi:MAG TPA: glycine oxidase ThiO [Gammaproteobacteria bacterium]|nr:glycine oxidase ThiO [Gammaproteobacteria bacterium]
MADFIIIGGGLIGLLTARSLSEGGAQVTLIERSRLGQESSWAGGGILSPLYPWKYPAAVNQLAHWSQAYYPTLVEELIQATGIDPEWTQSGLLVLDSDQREAAQAWAPEFEAEVQIVGAADIARLEPALQTEHPAGLWMPAVAQVRNPLLVQALRADLKLRGVRVAENTEVTHLLSKKGRIRGVQTELSEVMADQVIVACGAWSATLLKELGEEVPVMPVRGQMILFRGPPGLLQRIVLWEGHYVIPRRDGRILVGSTMEEVGFDKEITEEAREDLAQVARQMVPVLEDLPMERHWAGLRPGSPSGVPFIGPHPRIEGLFINAGHFRNGVVMAPASARLLTDIVRQQPTVVAPEPFAPAGRSSAA